MGRIWILEVHGFVFNNSVQSVQNLEMICQNFLSTILDLIVDGLRETYACVHTWMHACAHTHTHIEINIPGNL